MFKQKIIKMKSKYLLLAAVLPLGFTACQNDDFVQENIIGQDNLGKLIEAPLLGVGVETGDPTTRLYENGKWTWKPKVDPSAEAATHAISVDAIGLCWTGVNNNEDGYAGPLTETSDMVYTNVKFNHVGWLYEGQTAPSLRCGELQNGEFHDWDKTLTPQANWDGSYFAANKAGENLDFAKGMFKSGNGTIYEGEYIVYFPYNDSFWNAPVTAKQDRILDLAIEKEGESNYNVKDPYQLMSENAFNVGYSESIEGGKEACDFSTKVLTSGIRFELYGYRQIKEIVLWSKDQKGFITSQALSAKEIKKALQSGSGLSSQVYLEDPSNDASATLVVRTNDGTNSLTVAGTKQEFYVPFLPNTFKDLNILIVDYEGKVAVLDQWDDISFAANRPIGLKLFFARSGNVYKSDHEVGASIGRFEAKNYAYDEESFKTAYEKAVANASNPASEPRTVVLLDDIELTSQVTAYTSDKSNRIIIESAPDLVDEKNTLTLAGNAGKNAEKNILYGFVDTDFDINISTNPKGCCNNGKVSLNLRDVNTYAGTSITINGGELGFTGGFAYLAGNLYSNYEGKDEEGAYHPEVIPTVTIHNGATVTAKAAFVNEGVMTVTTGTTPGKLILDGATFTNREKKEYSSAKASIIVEGNGKKGQDGVILMKNGATLTNNGDIYNHGNIDNNSQSGAFTNNNGATFTDYVGSTLSGHRIVNNGTAEFICEVNSLTRYNNAIDLNGIRPTTIVRFVYGDDVNIQEGDYTTTYTLQPQEGKDGIYVPYAENSVLVKFESAIDVTSGESAPNTLTINNAVDAENNPIQTKIGDLTVKSGKINLNHESLIIDGDYTADGAANTQFNVGVQQISGNLILKNVIKDGGSNGDVWLVEDKTLNVLGDILVENVAGTVIFKDGSTVYAKNMTVNESQKVQFQKNNVTYLGSKEDKSTGILTNNGSIEIVNAVSGSDVAAKVWCNQRLGNNGTYVNNSYPQYY